MVSRRSRALLSSAMVSGVLASLPVVAVIIGCDLDRPPRHIHLEYPLLSAEVSGEEIYVEVAPNPGAESFLPRSLFGGLFPGVSALEAESLLGSPDEIVPDSIRHQNTVYRYKRSESSVEVVRYVSDSEGVATARWLLRACPVNSLLEAHLHAGIVDLLEQQPQARALVVLRQEGTPLFEVEIRKGRIACFYWYPPS